MKKALLMIVVLAMVAGAAIAGDIITKQGKETVVNTTTLAKGVRGFAGPTPVKIYISNGKITKVEPLANKETPRFFNNAKTLLKKYEGVTVKKAATMKVDAVSGATMSSKALIKNVQAGAKYYQKQK